MNNIKIWVLGDNRTGNTTQALSLAQELSNDYEFKNIEYNFLAKLPNCLLKLYPIHVKKKILQKLENSFVPDLIITAGRRVAPISLYLKKKFLNKPLLIQIMQPALPYENFDFVILPEHDSLKSNSSNIIKIKGALTNVSSKLKEEGVELRNSYPNLGNFTTVLIGGNSKNYNFADANAIHFASLLNNIPNQKFFISFSRRTPESVKQIIVSTLPVATIFYDPAKNMTINPYLGILSKADYIISTSDSISMCSEAASAGKPLYIYTPPSFKLPKHNFFINQLIKDGIARKFDESVVNLDKYNYTPLNEIERVAKIIKKKFFE